MAQRSHLDEVNEEQGSYHNGEDGAEESDIYELHEGKLNQKERVKQYAQDSEDINWTHRRLVLVLIICANTFLNFDTGIVPSELLSIQKELKINHNQVAYLGCLVYLGLCAASTVGSLIFHSYSPKKILFVALILNSIGCMCISFCESLTLIYALRL